MILAQSLGSGGRQSRVRHRTATCRPARVRGRFPDRVRGEGTRVRHPSRMPRRPGMADPVLKALCHEFHWLRRLSLGFVIRAFRRGGVERGRWPGSSTSTGSIVPGAGSIFSPTGGCSASTIPGGRANNDDSLLLGLIAEFRAAGLDCVSALDLCPELLVREGVLTRGGRPSAEEQDIAMGWHSPARWAGSTSARA